MATCPNKNLPEWKLLEMLHPDSAYVLWDRYDGFVPDRYYRQSDPKITIGEGALDNDNFEGDIYPIQINGEYAGSFTITKRDGRDELPKEKQGFISGSIGSYGIELESEFQGKGYGKKVYLEIAKKLSKEGITLKSEFFGKDKIGDKAKSVWNSLVREGYAVDRGEYFEVINPNKPQQNIPVSRASESTLDKVRKVIDKMGISIKDISAYLAGNPNVEAKTSDSITDLFQNIIAISQENEGLALTEEMVHVATAIIEQKNPSLINEMISKIGRFSIYKKVLNEYKDDSNYQLPNGKPNIRKIKKEAVDRLIAELIVNNNEGTTEFPELQDEANRSWVRKIWERVMDWFRGMYRETNIDIFSEAADFIIDGDVGNVSEVKLGGIYLQKSAEQKSIQQKIIDTRNFVLKKEEKDTKDVDPFFLDTEKANNWYELANQPGVALKRVTDRVKSWYKSKFKDKPFTNAQKIMNEFKRDQGTKYHRFFEEIHARFFDQNGERKTSPGPRPYHDNEQDRRIYDRLEKYFTGLIELHSENGTPLVFSEAIVYDPKNKEAGTIDLLIVEPDGKTHIYDWKFMSVASGAKDVAWFKQGAYNIQLKTYKNILRDYYNIDSFGKNRAIPILMDIRDRNKRSISKSKPEYFVNDVAIGSVDVSEIKELKLLPVSEETESTEIPEIDNLIDRLNAVHAKISSKKVKTEEEKEFKQERLNVIKQAIRIIQGTLNVEPIAEVISTMKREGENIIQDYINIYRDADIKNNNFTEKSLSEFSTTLQDYMAIGEVFGQIGDEITGLFYTKGEENLAVGKKEKEFALYKKRLAEKINEESKEIRLNTNKVKKIAGEFADKYIGRRNLVMGLLDAAKEINSIGAIFRGVSDLSNAATDVLFKVVSNSKAMAARDAHENVKKLMSIREKIMKGSNPRKRLEKIYQKDSKGNRINKLVYKYDRRFYETIDNLAQDPNRSIKDLKEYIDVEGYLKEAREMLEKRLRHISRTYVDPALVAKLSLEEKMKYDITDPGFNGYNNFIIKRHPKEDWISQEYKDIQKDKDLFELFSYISELNERANDLGYIENKVKNTFLPFVRKGFAESVAWDFSLSAVKRLAEDLSIRPDDVGYGAIDEITKDVVNTIPKYYTSDFTLKEDGSRDMSDVSEDLFKNLALYTTHLERYKYLSDVEGQLTLIQTIEKFKGSLKSTVVGNVAFDENGEPLKDPKNRNYKVYTNFLNAMLYGQKYPIATTDIAIPGISQAIQFGKNLVTAVTGKKFDKTEPTLNSLFKTIDAGNRYFQMKTLGGSFIAGSANLFGTGIQINTQAGHYFKAREFAKNAIKLIGNRFSQSDDRKAFVELVNLFMPLKDDPNYELIKKAGMTKLTQENAGDLLMVFMRMPEFHVEKTIFYTLLENTMIDENGKIVSIPEYVKSQYPNRNRSVAEYRTSTKKISAEIKKLKDTKSIWKTKKLVNGKLEIPGLDLTDKKEIQRLTALTRRISRNATGSLSDSDINQISLNIFGRSGMVFKGWIPKLVDTRFGEFRKISDDFSVELTDDDLTTGEKYDIGRIRLLGWVLGTSIRDKSTNLINIMKFNEKGILALDKMYEEAAQTYMKRTGKVLKFNLETGEYDSFISKADFIDLIRTNLRNQLKELAMLVSLWAVTVAVPPPDEDMSRSEKNFYRFTQKVANRFVSELSFFYNPMEFQRMLGGSAFPVLGLATDLIKFTKHTTMELTGLDISHPEKTYEEVLRDARPLKYGAKLFPITKEFINYFALFDDEFAKEWDIYIQSTNR